MLDEKRSDELRQATVRLVLDVRREYLMCGASPLKAWDQIGDRMRAATRQSTGPEEWATRLCRSLQLGQPSSSTSHSMAALSVLLPDRRARGDWLDLIEREHAYVIALARLEAERRRDVREAEQAETAAALAETPDASLLGPDVTAPPTRRRKGA